MMETEKRDDGRNVDTKERLKVEMEDWVVRQLTETEGKTSKMEK